MRNRKVLVVALSISLVVAGCSAAAVWAQIQKWEPFALQAFSELVQILQAGGVFTSATATAVSADAVVANGDFANLASTVNAIVTANAASTGNLNKAIADLQALQMHLGQLEADAHLTNTQDQQAFQLGIQGIITSLAAFQAQLTPVAAGKAKLSSVKLPNADTFKKQFNAIMVSHGHAQNQI